MEEIQALVAQLMFASLRYLPVIAIPAMSPLSWAPGMVRIAVLLCMAWLTVLASPAGAYLAIWQQPVGLLLACASELLLGLTFALAVMLPQAALGMSAAVADLQAGLSAATLFNPGGQNEQQTMTGTIVMLAATVLFFTLHLHLLLFQTMAASVQLLPLGALAVHLDVDGFMDMLGSSFILGVAVMAPVILGMFALDLGIAYATRSMPQANVYFLALPLKVLVALLLLAMTLRFAPALIGRLYQDAFARLPAVLGT
jgi:flagellar biosynthetic protein FliR